MAENEFIRDIVCPGPELEDLVDGVNQEMFHTLFEIVPSLKVRKRKAKKALKLFGKLPSDEDIEFVLREEERSDLNILYLNKILNYSNRFREIDEARVEIDKVREEILYNLRYHVIGRKGLIIEPYEGKLVERLFYFSQREIQEHLDKTDETSCEECLRRYDSYVKERINQISRLDRPLFEWQKRVKKAYKDSGYLGARRTFDLAHLDIFQHLAQ